LLDTCGSIAQESAGVKCFFFTEEIILLGLEALTFWAKSATITEILYL
jgi:hypothetical protein